MLRALTKVNKFSYTLVTRSFSQAAVPLSQQTTLEDDLHEFFTTLENKK
jgi:hypothetical protein